jgi:hypothetical protein
LVDDFSIVSPKIKSFNENISDDGPFSDFEPYEEEIFYDVRREDRICAQCKQDHSFKPNFEGVKTSIERIPDIFSNKKRGATTDDDISISMLRQM